MRGKKNEKGAASAKVKGDVVERVVAMMHEGAGAEVRRDVRLPAKNDKSHHRQIDVLLVGETAGYPTLLAIECKNFKRNVNVRDVGAFKDLLEDVGLAPQQGILVSASKIGSGAMRRAKEIGMRMFELEGLTPDGLSEAVREASQMVVFVVAAMSEFSVVNMAERVAHPHEMLMLFDEDGDMAGYLHDLLWLRWLEGRPPSVLGEHQIEIGVPKGWYMRVSGRREPVLSASAKVKVRAAVVDFRGSSTGIALLDPEKGAVERFRATASFETLGEHPVAVFEEEAELEAFLRDRRAATKVVVGRIRAPRIQVNYVYWPPSERLLRRVLQYEKFYRRGRLGVPRPEDFRGVEGNDLNALWETIAADAPARRLLERRVDGRLAS